MPGRSIRIFLPDGTPGGLRTAELGMSTIKAVVAPRSLLERLAERPEVRRTGVYLLVGEDPAIPGRGKLYVGEGDDVLSRLRSHNTDDAKDFFDRVFVFVSKDDNLTKAHVRWLEAHLIDRVRLANRITLANGVNPEGGGLPEADLSEMGEFLDQLQLLLSALGLSVFEPTSAASASQKSDGGGKAEVFRIQGEGYQGTASVLDGAFVVAKGSVARETEVESLSDSIRALRAQLSESHVLQKGADGLRFVQDYEFSSPSQAAQVVCGFSVNGRQAWKTAHGKTFAAWQDEHLASAAAAG